MSDTPRLCFNFGPCSRGACLCGEPCQQTGEGRLYPYGHEAWAERWPSIAAFERSITAEPRQTKPKRRASR